MSKYTEDQRNEAYRIARDCLGFKDLSEKTKIGANTLREWNKDRKFYFKQRFCSCKGPITKAQPEFATTCQTCTIEKHNKNFIEKRKNRSGL